MGIQYIQEKYMYQNCSKNYTVFQNHDIFDLQCILRYRFAHKMQLGNINFNLWCRMLVQKSLKYIRGNILPIFMGFIIGQNTTERKCSIIIKNISFRDKVEVHINIIVNTIYNKTKQVIQQP